MEGHGGRGRTPRLNLPPAAEAVAFAAVALVTYWITGPPATGDMWPPLAEAFLDGKLYLAVDRPWLELVPRTDGGQYVPLPPVPALTLIPLAIVTGPDTILGELARKHIRQRRTAPSTWPRLLAAVRVGRRAHHRAAGSRRASRSARTGGWQAWPARITSPRSAPSCSACSA